MYLPLSSFKIDVPFKITIRCVMDHGSILDFDPIVILKVTSTLGGLKEDINPPYNIPQFILISFL
jgi:hypothetical protein